MKVTVERNRAPLGITVDPKYTWSIHCTECGYFDFASYRKDADRIARDHRTDHAADDEMDDILAAEAAAFATEEGYRA